MSKEELKIGEISKPRFEFRSFGQDFEKAAQRHKQRFGYMVNNTICEVGNVLINGAKVVTINSESTEVEDIKKTVADIGLDGVENINYLQAIKRVTGMISQPLAN